VTTTTMVEAPRAERSGGAERRSWWKTALAVAVVVAVFGFFFPRLASYRDVWSTIQRLSPTEIAVLVVVSSWNLLTYWLFNISALPGLRIREAAVSNLASTAVANTVPAGAAVGIGVTASTLSSWGFDAAAITRFTLVTGIWNNFVKLGLPVVALGVLASSGEVTRGLGIASVIGLAVLVASMTLLALMLRSDSLAGRIGGWLARPVNAIRRLARRPEVSDLPDRAADFRRDVVELVRRRWPAITATCAVSHLSLWLVLLLSVRAVGLSESDVGWAQTLAAFAFVRLLSAVPVTPGGVGVAELGLTAALAHGLSDALAARAAAAVLLFRALTWFVPIPLGLAAYAFWNRNESWRCDERTDPARW
jgi:putative heme transporter